MFWDSMRCISLTSNYLQTNFKDSVHNTWKILQRNLQTGWKLTCGVGYTIYILRHWPLLPLLPPPHTVSYWIMFLSASASKLYVSTNHWQVIGNDMIVFQGMVGVGNSVSAMTQYQSFKSSWFALNHAHSSCSDVLRVRYQGPLLLTWLNLIPAWISYHMPRKVWDEITYSFTNFNGCTVEVWKWVSDFIPRFIMNVITCP